MRIETKRLILREPKTSDLKDLVEGLNDLEVSKNLAVHPYPYTKKDAVRDMKFILKEWKKEDKLCYSFVIELKSEKKVIGETGIYQISKNDEKAVIGYWINKKYWRKGYNIEASIPVLDFAFNKLKLRKIEDAVWVENKASNNMLKKLGFKFEGTLRKSLICEANRKIHDVSWYGLFKEEWEKTKPKIIKELNKKTKIDPEILYHGSPKKLVGKFLITSKGEDSEERPENNQVGIYATNTKEIAIAMAIVSSKGVIGASLDDYKSNKVPGIIHFGKPTQKYIYLYTLSPKGFRKTPKIKDQWISKKSVKPLRIEKLKISDYVHLIKYSNKSDARKWKEKYMKRDYSRRDLEIKHKVSNIKKRITKSLR